MNAITIAHYGVRLARATSTKLVTEAQSAEVTDLLRSLSTLDDKTRQAVCGYAIFALRLGPTAKPDDVVRSWAANRQSKRNSMYELAAVLLVVAVAILRVGIYIGVNR